MAKIDKWTSENEKWKVKIVEKGQNRFFLNISEKKNVMLTHVHMAVVENLNGIFYLSLQNNRHSKRIPQYVKDISVLMCR